MSITFTSLHTQYTSFSKNEKVFLAATPSGPEFLSKSFLFRLIDTIFFGYSYDIVTSAKALFEKAKNISTETCSEAELIAAIKVTKIAQDILIGSAGKDPCKKNHFGRRIARNESQKTIQKLADALAKRQNLSKIEVLFTYKCYQELLDTIKHEKIPSSLSPSLLQPILQFVCEQNETEAALILIQHGVSTKELRNIEPSYMALLAYEANARSNDTALSFLIEEQETIWKSEELYLAAVQRGLFSSIKRFIEKKQISPDFADCDKNTALHIAFMKCDFPLVFFLLQHCNPVVKNNLNQTPLQALLASPEIVSKSELKVFIEAFFARRPEDPQGVILDHTERIVEKTIPVDTLCDSIELCFLLQKPLSLIAPYVPREDFEKAIFYLKKKYPKANLDEFFIASFNLNLKHLKTGCDRLPVSKQIPKNTPLDVLVTLFDELPWNEIDLTQFYVEVFERRFFAGDPKALIREELLLLLRKIQKREPFAGTPEEGGALEEFYLPIELSLRHTAAKLIERKDPKLTLSFFQEVLRATKHCGGRYFHTATDVYLRICHEVKLLPRGIFEQFLADYRQICFEGVVGDLYEGYANAFTHAKKDLGKELGIPGATNTFEDPYTVLNYNAADIRKIFFEKAYNPYSIIFYYLLPAIEQDARIRDAYLDLQKEATPPAWHNEQYKKALEEIAALPSNIKDEDRKKAEDAILTRHEIYRSTPDQSIPDAIEECRKLDFLSSFVYDPEKRLKLTALPFLLERLEILTNMFSWKDPSNNIVPLSNAGAYSKVSLIGGTFTSIGSFFKSLLSYWSH